MSTDADRRLAALAARHDGVFTIADAAAAGLSHHRIRQRVADEWIRCHQGVYRASGAPESFLGELRAAARAVAPHGFISHTSGAAFYELPGGRTDRVEVTCPRGLRARHPDLEVHETRRLDAADFQLVAGFHVTTPERLIVDMAGLRPVPNYVERLIQAARRKRLVTYDSMHLTFVRLATRGRKGIPALRTALDRWNPDSRPTESEMETLLLQVLRGHGHPEPTPQFVVRDDGGMFVARVDAALLQWRITIEYDSKQEHSDEFQLARGDARRNRIVSAGYSHLVARHRDLVDGGEELHRAIRAIQRNWRRKVG